MPRKAAQLQVRVTAAQKSRLRRLAAAAGQDVSAYVLARALPDARLRVDAALRTLRDDSARKFALAELADALAPLGVDELERAVEHADVARLSAFAQNYVAAMVEEACATQGITPPAWTRDVAPLDAPWFATPLRGLRVHLLRASPVPYKRRNLFVDAGASARV